jgi:hypothetical protein
MAERLKAHAWKACVRESVPWVRIPLPPPNAGNCAIPTTYCIRNQHFDQFAKYPVGKQSRSRLSGGRLEMEPSFLVAGAGDAILCTRQIASLMVASRFAKGQAAGRSGRGFGQRDGDGGWIVRHDNMPNGYRSGLVDAVVCTRRRASHRSLQRSSRRSPQRRSARTEGVRERRIVRQCSLIDLQRSLIA